MKTDRIPLFWMLLLVVVFVLLAFDARATKPKPGGNSVSSSRSESISKATSESVSKATSEASVSVGGVSVPVTQGSVTGGNTTMQGGDVTVGGDSNRAYAFANSLGDVDIAGCLGSEQWNTPLFGKQKLVTNWACLTEFYLRNGMYQNAAIAICNTDIRREFETEQECRDAHPFKELSISISTPEIDNSHDEDEEHERLEAEIAALRADLSAAKEKARKATVEARYAVQQAQKAPEQAQYGISEDQVAALEEWQAKWGKK